MQSHWTLKPHSENGWNESVDWCFAKLWADWTILAVIFFSDFLFNQHVQSTWMYHYDLLRIFHRIRIFTTSTHLSHFSEVKTWNSHSSWSIFFRCAIEQKFETHRGTLFSAPVSVTPIKVDIASFSSGEKHHVSKSNCENERFPVSNEGEHVYYGSSRNP